MNVTCAKSLHFTSYVFVIMQKIRVKIFVSCRPADPKKGREIHNLKSIFTKLPFALYRIFIGWISYSLCQRVSFKLCALVFVPGFLTIWLSLRSTSYKQCLRPAPLTRAQLVMDKHTCGNLILLSSCLLHLTCKILWLNVYRRNNRKKCDLACEVFVWIFTNTQP